ncbi:MAG: hypothetical protein HQL51_14800, partial [Magnetococcales bacterium]|nr:hypothetical protein [Magnetococcales bacterium]
GGAGGSGGSWPRWFVREWRMLGLFSWGFLAAGMLLTCFLTPIDARYLMTYALFAPIPLLLTLDALWRFPARTAPRQPPAAVSPDAGVSPADRGR